MDLKHVKDSFNKHLDKDGDFAFAGCKLLITDGIHPAKDIRWIDIDFQDKSLTLIASDSFLEAKTSLIDLLLKLLADSQYDDYRVLLKGGVEYSEVVGVLVGQPIFFIAKNKRLLKVEN